MHAEDVLLVKLIEADMTVEMQPRKGESRPSAGRSQSQSHTPSNQLGIPRMPNQP